MGQVEAPTKMIAKRVRELRAARKWTAQQLAEKITEAGVEWNRGTVAKLENGRRTAVSVEELFALAWALGVPPVVLVLPDDAGAECELTPAVTAEANRVFGWLVGCLPQPSRFPCPEQDAEQYFASMPSYMHRVRVLGCEP